MEKELHDVFVFFYMLFKVGCYTGLILVPVILLVCELVKQNRGGVHGRTK